MADDPNPSDDGEDLQVFVARVQHGAGLESSSEAEVLARATLRSLGEQVSQGQARKLSGALPSELASEVTSGRSAQANSVDKATFVNQVSAEVHVTDAAEVERQIRIVLSVVRGWAPDGQVEPTLAQLPEPLAALFA